MDLYSLILVDDEEEVISIIRDMTDWEALGFRVAGVAGNGVEALEMMEELQADVVMTDIKMPYMDGLTLSRKLKEEYPDVRIIIFSGFDEFEYAKEAIKIEAEEYLLKPVDPGELASVFTRVRDVLDRVRAERRDMDLLRSYYMQSLPMLQENFTISLIEGRVPSGRMGRYLSSYQLELEGPYFAAALLHVSGTKTPDDRDSLLFTVSVRRLVEEQLREKYRLKTANYLGDLAVVAELADESGIMDFTDSMDLICRQAKRMYDVAVTAGIGSVCSDPMDIRKSFTRASNALALRAIYGNTRAINIQELEPDTDEDESWEKEAVEELISLIRLGEIEDFRAELEASLGRLRTSASGIAAYQSFMMELIAGISYYAAAHKVDSESTFGGQKNIYRAVFESESPEETLTWLMNAVTDIDSRIRKRRDVAATSFVERAEEYVRDNYPDADITVDSVCRRLGVSAAYFSTVFKKETGKTFISYLTDYRLDRAVELLRSTPDKTYMIARQVGYSDSNYFSYVFKKKYGISPSRFRSM